MHGLSLVVVSGGYPIDALHRLLPLQWLLLLQLVDPRAQAQQLWRTDSAALQRVTSSQTRDHTHVPCTGRWTPNHWTAREVYKPLLLFSYTQQNLMLMNSPAFVASLVAEVQACDPGSINCTQ